MQIATIVSSTLIKNYPTCCFAILKKKKEKQLKNKHLKYFMILKEFNIIVYYFLYYRISSIYSILLNFNYITLKFQFNYLLNEGINWLNKVY